MRYIDSNLPLYVHEVRVQERFREGLHEPCDVLLGTTPHQGPGPGVPVPIAADAIWHVGPLHRKLTDDGLFALCQEVRRQGWPGLSLEYCRWLTDAGMRHLTGLPHLR